MDAASDESKHIAGLVRPGDLHDPTALPAGQTEGDFEEVEDDEEEACCVCLDSLSSAPVAILLRDDAEPISRACPHMFHSACAERLSPSKCPLCRTVFNAISEPINRATLVQVDVEDLLLTLRRLDGQGSKRFQVTASVDSVVQLLAATLPLAESSLRRALGCADDCEVSVKQVHQLLVRLGIFEGAGHLEAQLSLGSSSTRHDVCCRRIVFRRFRRFALIAAAGAGTGILIGVLCAFVCALIGGIVEAPWSQFPNNPDDVVFEALIFIIRSCMRRGTLALIGFGSGGSLGFMVGVVHHFFRVNPDNVGIWKAFWAGLRGKIVCDIFLRCTRCCRRPQLDPSAELSTGVPIFRRRTREVLSSVLSRSEASATAAIGDGSHEAASS